MPLVPFKGEKISRTDHAFLRLSTPEDLRDAVFLALSGVHVAFESVPGCLTGFGKPFELPLQTRRGQIVERTPESVAAAVLAMVTCKDFRGSNASRPPLSFSVEDEAVANVLRGIGLCLSQRAGRMLSRTDIADIMGWVACLTDARIDAQIPYGCEEWGAFLRREPADHDLGWYPPPERPNVSRTLVCHVRPAVEDLERILAHAPVGIINAQVMRKGRPWAAGLSADKSLILGTHCLAPMLSWLPHDGGEPVPVLDRGTLLSAGDLEAALRKLYGEAWDRVREISAEGYQMTLAAVPGLLQAIWGHQRGGLHLYGVDVEKMPPCRVDDLRRHALDGGYKASAEVHLPRPQGVLTMAAPTIQAQAALLGVGVDHNAPVVIDPEDAGATAKMVHEGWDGFMGGTVPRLRQSRPICR